MCNAVRADSMTKLRLVSNGLVRDPKIHEMLENLLARPGFLIPTKERLRNLQIEATDTGGLVEDDYDFIVDLFYEVNDEEFKYKSL